MLESFAQDWSGVEAYRGANSNMHATEAFLALADVTGETRWLDRALRIVERIIHTHAAENRDMVIEHFDSHWQPLRGYNEDNPADGFRPYGITPGHGFEWARLVLHLEAARLESFADVMRCGFAFVREIGRQHDFRNDAVSGARDQFFQMDVFRADAVQR